jgi:Holliday junction resolvasome RuvABC endonuclease subunit
MSKIIAIDLSINGTGMTVYDTEDKYHKFYSFPAYNKFKPIDRTKPYRQSHSFEGDGYDCTIFYLSHTFETELERLINTARIIFQKIYRTFKDADTDVYVCMEEQVFSAFRSSATVQIGEFNGILKYLINRYCYTIPYLLNNKTMKKVVVGNGNSKKEDVYDFYMRTPFYRIIEDISEKSNNKRYGTFIEDIIDSKMILDFFLKTYYKGG